jgi:hypothetical protein
VLITCSPGGPGQGRSCVAGGRADVELRARPPRGDGNVDRDVVTGLCLGFGALFLLVLLVGVFADQQRLWWRGEAWSYRHPEANEPSAAAFAANRAGMIVLGGIGLVAVVAILVGTAPPDIGPQAHAAARRLEQGGPVVIERRAGLAPAGAPADAVANALSESAMSESADRVWIVATSTAVPDKQYLFTLAPVAGGGEYCLELTTTAPPRDRTTRESRLYLPGRQIYVPVPPEVIGREAPVDADVFAGACTGSAHGPVLW